MPVIREIKGRFKGTRQVYSLKGAAKSKLRFLHKYPSFMSGARTGRIIDSKLNPLSNLNPYRKVGLVSKFRRRIAGGAALGVGAGALAYAASKKKKKKRINTK